MTSHSLTRSLSLSSSWGNGTSSRTVLGYKPSELLVSATATLFDRLGGSVIRWIFRIRRKARYPQWNSVTTSMGAFERKLDNSIRDERSPKTNGELSWWCSGSFTLFMWCSMLVEGSELDIGIHKNTFQRWKEVFCEPCVKLISSSTIYGITCLLE